MVRKIYNIQIQMFLKYHLQKCTLLSLQELKSQDIVSISTLSALILNGMGERTFVREVLVNQC